MEPIAKGQSVGHKRIEKVSGQYDALKLEITEKAGAVYISNLACYGSN